MRTPLADYQPQTCRAFRTLLDEKPGFDIINDARDTKSLIELTGKHLPDLVALETDLPSLYDEERIS